MKKSNVFQLDFEIDILTNSIENSLTGEVFNTEVTRLTKENSVLIKKPDWQFNWQNELRDKEREVYKLTTLNNPLIIHGLISLTDKGDHVFMNLIENAKFNKGSKKQYKGVAGNLVAFACKSAFEKNYDGVVSFIAKTQLIPHYQITLAARLFAGNRMFIDTKEALTLVQRYFKDFRYGKL